MEIGTGTHLVLKNPLYLFGGIQKCGVGLSSLEELGDVPLRDAKAALRWLKMQTPFETLELKKKHIENLIKTKYLVPVNLIL